MVLILGIINLAHRSGFYFDYRELDSYLHSVLDDPREFAKSFRIFQSNYSKLLNYLVYQTDLSGKNPLIHIDNAPINSLDHFAEMFEIIGKMEEREVPDEPDPRPDKYAALCPECRRKNQQILEWSDTMLKMSGLMRA